MLRIEHPVADFAGWKKLFDGDPVGRKKSGERSSQNLRGDASKLSINIGSRQANRGLAGRDARGVGRVQGTVMSDPKVRIVEAVETTAL